MKNELVSESPARYGAMIRKPVLRNGSSVVLPFVSAETFRRVAAETGEQRDFDLAYRDGEIEISGFTGTSIVLHGISWETFKRVLAETGDDRSARFAYDEGEWEIMSPYMPHERAARYFDACVKVLCREYRYKCIPGGALTCEQEEWKKAIEPDSCYYIQNAGAIDEHIDLKKDPPPDLMIEVDRGNRNSVKKLPICLALRVPEHWRYDGKKLEFRVLRGGEYIEVNQSATFPGLPLKEKLPEILRFVRGVDVLDVEDNFRAWVRAQLKKKAGKKRK